MIFLLCVGVNIKKMILIFSVIFLLLIPGCGRSLDTSESSPSPIVEEPEEAEAEDGSIFGRIQTFESMNGEWALATVDKNIMTDDVLIDYYFSNINDSGYKWFVIDFNNGTGYMFPGSRNSFEYIYQHEDDWSISDLNKILGTGYIYKDRVEYTPADEPHDDYTTIEVYVEALIALIEESVSDNFGDNYLIEYDADYNAVVLSIWYYGLAEEVGTAITNDSVPAYLKSWQNVIDVHVTLNKQCMNTAERLEVNVDIITNVLSDLNLDNTLLTIYNGVVTYNVLDD